MVQAPTSDGRNQLVMASDGSVVELVSVYHCTSSIEFAVDKFK